MRIGPVVGDEWDNYRNAELFYNSTTPGTKNGIRTTLHRLWLKPLLHIDPDVAYFDSTKNSLTKEQKRLLQDLAQICEFKATSDLPQWMTKDETDELRSFLTSTPKVEQTSRYTFRLDDREVDFTSATSLPNKKTGTLALLAGFLSWMGDRHFVLRVNKRLDDGKFRKRRNSL